MPDTVVQIERLSKRYHLGSLGARTLSGDLSRRWAKLWGKPDPLSKIGAQDAASNENGCVDGEIWALRDVSFEVRQGEVLGIIGRNGAGKSTLLKILSRVTAPTDGEVRVSGRIASLLEVGTGFHPELTGRENIFLNGAILGMTTGEIKRKFDEIVEFSEVAKFIDTPVKRYSSGMYVRLAFAVAAHLEPEILIVDEVLAVGDAGFQRKCLGKMGDVARQGRTVFLVSHNMAAISRLADRVLLLESGQLRLAGLPEETIAKYLSSDGSEASEVRFSDASAPGSEYVRLRAARLRNPEGLLRSVLDIRRPFTIEIEYEVLQRVTTLRIGISLIAQDSTVVLSSTDLDDCEDEFERLPGRYVNRCTVSGQFLNEGHYFVSLGADFPMSRVHFYADRVLSFQVEQTGGVGGHIPDRRPGVLRLRLPWEIEPADRSALSSTVDHTGNRIRLQHEGIDPATRL
jgi:lipopolysaccharide transport system ATP-binding protein